MAHEFLGDGFGTVYDLSTILILWFAGASAMAGLLNIVPRYLPRYGMAPEWTRATRPLVLVFTAVAFVVTLLFRADVDAQGGAYATGVLVLITSASIAVTLAARRAGQRGLTLAFGAIALAFVYTTLVNVAERPDGVKIAAVFIAAVVVVSLVSRAARATELRAPAVVLDATARRFVAEAAAQGPVRFIANEPNARDTLEYTLKEWEEREATHIPAECPVLFLEVTVRDPSEFAPVVEVAGEAVGAFRVLRAEGASIPNAIAAVLLHVRDATGVRPHAYFNWSEYPPRDRGGALPPLRRGGRGPGHAGGAAPHRARPRAPARRPRRLSLAPFPGRGRPRPGKGALIRQVVGDGEDGGAGAEQEGPLEAQRRLRVQHVLPPVRRDVLREQHRHHRGHLRLLALQGVDVGQQGPHQGPVGRLDHHQVDPQPGPVPALLEALARRPRRR